MKVSIGELADEVSPFLELSELYNGVLIKADDGIVMAVCQRDGAFEIHYSTDGGENWSPWEKYPPDQNEAPAPDPQLAADLTALRERTTVRHFMEMCDESLSPDEHTRAMSTVRVLKQRRKAFQDERNKE